MVNPRDLAGNAEEEEEEERYTRKNKWTNKLIETPSPNIFHTKRGIDMSLFVMQSIRTDMTIYVLLNLT